ncbi:adenylate/guanylate cyclase domain-containing protein, partial [Candidatus Ozemobacteraceae bacterium]|nr:adenylate/guanylate cyclase domain-containing protein [Candidatus Ozemobacteraceae bacterium]
NEYFTEMDRVIRGFGGEIDKLVGDAIQAVFKEGEGIEHPAIRAARAGLAMRRSLAALNHARSLRGEFTVENGVGIHFGKMIAGKVGATGGRQDFTVIGSAVAFAARLEAASRRGVRTKVIVSAETAALIAREFPCEPLEGVEEKGACEIVRDPVENTETAV